MAERKNISKKTRFEVLKRDNFQCQYCGDRAPDTCLEVDHMQPVAEGGDNDVINLITSCVDCNQGKGACVLDPSTTIEKQRQWRVKVKEDRLQLQMLTRLRESLAVVREQDVDEVCAAIGRYRGAEFSPDKYVQRKIRWWLSSYSVDQIIRAVKISYTEYLEAEGQPGSGESSSYAFLHVPRIAAAMSGDLKMPHLQHLYSIRESLRNSLPYLDDIACARMLEEAFEHGTLIECLKKLFFACREWESFGHLLEGFLDCYDDDWVR